MHLACGCRMRAERNKIHKESAERIRKCIVHVPLRGLRGRGRVFQRALTLRSTAMRWRRSAVPKRVEGQEGRGDDTKTNCKESNVDPMASTIRCVGLCNNPAHRCPVPMVSQSTASKCACWRPAKQPRAPPTKVGSGVCGCGVWPWSLRVRGSAHLLAVSANGNGNKRPCASHALFMLRSALYQVAKGEPLAPG